MSDKKIYPFTPEAYRNKLYNEINGYTRKDYEQHADWDVDEYDDWLERRRAHRFGQFVAEGAAAVDAAAAENRLAILEQNDRC